MSYIVIGLLGFALVMALLHFYLNGDCSLLLEWALDMLIWALLFSWMDE